MRILVPDFIMNKYEQKQFEGTIEAYVLNADLKGFTALTEAMMSHSYSGVEILIDTIKSMFTPALTAIENRGGFVTAFAGDAFTAVFPGRSAADVVSSAIEMRDFIVKNGRISTEFGEFDLAVRIGVAYGKVEWNIIDTEAQSSFWFSGEGILRAVEAQGIAQSNEVIAEQALCREIGFGICDCKEIDNGYCFIDNIIQIPERPVPHVIAESYSPFMPDEITSMTSEGEFREVVPCFVNLAEQDKSQVAKIIRAARNLGGFLSNIESTDKGWVMYVIFGAPLEYEKSAMRAIEFALEVKAICDQNFRIGMTRGMVFAGFVGSPLRSEYAALGMAVNLASRLMTNAKWGEVWFDQSMQKAVGRSIVYQELGELSFKGHPLPIFTCRLLNKQEKVVPSYFHWSFIGRDTELNKLATSCQPLNEGKFAGVSYIYGEAGQGKSRLVYELDQKLGNKVQCFHLQTDSIYQNSLNPFSYWIRQQFTTGMTGNIASRRDEFRSLWADFAEKIKALPRSEQIYRELERIESIIAGLIGLEWEGSLYTNLEPKYRPSATGFALKSLLEAYCLIMPVLLVIEDLQWLDSESENVIVILTRRTALPFKLILTARLFDQGLKPVLKLDKNVPVEEINLFGLDRSQITLFMKEMLKRDVSTELIEYAFSISQGNPFIVEQFSIYLLESGYLKLLGNSYHLKEHAQKLPSEVQSLLVVRLDRLEGDLKRTVQTASVLGCEFASIILSSMLERIENRTEYLNEVVVQSQLHAGEEEHIWHAVSEIKYIFSHSLLRDAAYSMQLKKQLKNLHLLAGQIMEKHYSDDKAKYGEIAYHFDYAGDWSSAVKYYTETGNHEKELFHFEASFNQYLKALVLSRKHEGERNSNAAFILSRIGSVFWGSGDYDKALTYFEQALSIRKELRGERYVSVADSLNSIATMYYVKGQYDHALELYNQALSIWSEAFGDKHHDTAISLNNIGNVYDAKGEYDNALKYYELGLAIRQETFGLQHFETAISFNNIGDVYDHKGDYSQALTYYQKALSIRQTVLGNKHPGTAVSLNCIADVCSQTGEFEKAISYYEQALSILRDLLGERHSETAISLNNIGNAYDNMGEFDKALSYYQQALSIRLEVFGDKHPDTAVILNNIGCAYDHSGEYDRALPYYEKALTVWKEVLGERHSETAACLNNIGCIFENKGDFDKALPYYEQALSIWKEVLGDNSPETSVGLINVGCIFDNKGDYVKALVFYKQALAIRKEVFGENHPATLRAVDYIAKTYQKMEDNDKI